MFLQTWRESNSIPRLSSDKRRRTRVHSILLKKHGLTFSFIKSCTYLFVGRRITLTIRQKKLMTVKYTTNNLKKICIHFTFPCLFFLGNDLKIKANCVMHRLLKRSNSDFLICYPCTYTHTHIHKKMLCLLNRAG